MHTSCEDKAKEFRGALKALCFREGGGEGGFMKVCKLKEKGGIKVCGGRKISHLLQPG